MASRKSAKEEAAARAAASGLASKLSAYFAFANRVTSKRPPLWRHLTLHKNASQLARWITDERGKAFGDTVAHVTVGAWEKGENLPAGRYVGYLEEVLLAPWPWIDNPRTKWREDDEMRLKYLDLLVEAGEVPAAERDRVAAALLSALAAFRRGQPA